MQFKKNVGVATLHSTTNPCLFPKIGIAQLPIIDQGHLQIQYNYQN